MVISLKSENTAVTCHAVAVSPTLQVFSVFLSLALGPRFELWLTVWSLGDTGTGKREQDSYLHVSPEQGYAESCKGLDDKYFKLCEWKDKIQDTIQAQTVPNLLCFNLGLFNRMV